ncbi:uncharacterized protein LOC110726292 [Chenopodium quinoa]|uniref:uncharacterized protein LOC110726292 n=1 Tax=Chenopodium quinoa TaxID=63459 RepID=UPI000B78BE88|nr:uncharacterized protein LOC110726292 [Chenopodium quinoa]
MSCKKLNSVSNIGKSVSYQRQVDIHLSKAIWKLKSSYLLPSYLCSSSLLPNDVAKELDSLHRKFFWRQEKDKNCIPLIAWDKICRPKNAGGLGLRRTMPLNNAFIAKLGWKIISEPNSLLVKIIRDKYLCNKSFFECIPNVKDSYIWRKILAQWEILRKGIRWKIGNVMDIHFWIDNWATNQSLLELRTSYGSKSSRVRHKSVRLHSP